MIKQWAHQHIQGDQVIWFIVLGLSILSVLVVYSATGTLAYAQMEGDTEHYLFKHTSFMLLSLFAMWAAHKIDYRYYANLSKLALWLSVPLLMVTWKFGMNINEASRWITIPYINQAFQPSDLAKFALIVMLSSMLAKRQANIDNVKESLIPLLLWIGVICGLIAISNFSTATLLFSTCMLMLFIGRVPMKYLLILAAIGLMSGGVALAVGQRSETVVNRVKTFASAKHLPYQLEQSYIAIASGGIRGLGPGQSNQRNFLPHPYSDFIYAIVIEEYGVVGGIAVLFAYLALLYRGTRLVSRTERTYGALLSAGLSFALVLQALVNMGVAVGLGPITGLTLPLVSMGGTSQLFTGIAMGIILSVSRGGLEEVESPAPEENTYKQEAETSTYAPS